ncbi:TetR/AcrR family transcriptional regulator [Actinoplanes sp. OR16]|uniref:TetR/AcrR family transcriptional regulator n=1 Tax=Actinoplanes sp. OR16 TaxID=946334 RepID=UPI00135F193E|nr:TetR/AcrR family transcriptional regulator [Actinoplanes sp. OR16]
MDPKRAAVLLAAQQALTDGRQLQLNEIARSAGVGVGTVYRHFATPQALLETLVGQRLQALTQQAQTAASAQDTAEATRGFLRTTLLVLTEDPALAQVLAEAEDALPSTGVLKTELSLGVDRLLRRAVDEKVLPDWITSNDLERLLCGVAFAARLHPGPAAKPAAQRYLDALLDGLLTSRPADPPSPSRRWPASATPTASPPT